MLVLSRKPNEEIIIDDHIRIQVIDVRGGRVRLGIAAAATYTFVVPSCHRDNRIKPRPPMRRLDCKFANRARKRIWHMPAKSACSFQPVGKVS